MSNLTDALIAAKLIGAQGGGSGGGSGLPEIRTETVTIVEEQTVTGFQDTGGGLYLGTGGSVDFSGLANGDLVDVIFDGTTYHTSVSSMQGLILIGNQAILGKGEDTGEPFALSDGMQPNVLSVLTRLTGASHTVGANAITYSPKNGSILIVNNGEWQSVELSGVYPLCFGGVGASGSFTVPANNSLHVSDLSISQIVGVPSSWSSGMAMGMVRVRNGNYNTTGVFLLDANFDFTNSKITGLDLYNPTSSPITFSGLFFNSGIAKIS